MSNTQEQLQLLRETRPYLYDEYLASRLDQASLSSTPYGYNSSNWGSVYTTVYNTSSDWDSVYTTVNTTSSTWGASYISGAIMSSYDNRYVNITGDTMTGDLKLAQDNTKLYFGAADDASITFDGNSLNIVANATTTTNKLEFTGGGYVFNNYTQAAANTTQNYIAGAFIHSSSTSSSTIGNALSLTHQISGTETGSYVGKSSRGIYLDIDDTSVVNGALAIHQTYGFYADMTWAGTNTNNQALSMYGLSFSVLGNMGTTGVTEKKGVSTVVGGTADNNYGFYAVVSGATNNWAFYNATGTVFLGVDNAKTYFGTANDASLYYDGTDLVINSHEVGSGGCKINTLNIRADGTIQPIQTANVSAVNDSIYYSTDANEVVYKDSTGSISEMSFNNSTITTAVTSTGSFMTLTVNGSAVAIPLYTY